jgi:hypothetical protein
MSSFIRFITFLIRRSQSKFQKNYLKTLLSFLTRLITLVYLFFLCEMAVFGLIPEDNVCIESLSIDLTRPMLDAAGRSVGKLGEKIEE